MNLLFYWILCEINYLFFYLGQFMFWAWRSSSASGCFLLPASTWPGKKLQRPASHKSHSTAGLQIPPKLSSVFPRLSLQQTTALSFPLSVPSVASSASPRLDCPVPQARCGEGTIAEHCHLQPQQTPSLPKAHSIFPLGFGPENQAN